MANELTASKTQFNFLKNSQFQLVIPRLPNVAFYTVQTGIPALSVGYATAPTPFKQLAFTGETPEFEDFVCTFIIDSKLNNYYEVYDWIRGYSRIGHYENLKDYVVANGGNPNAIKEKDLICDINHLILGDKGCEIASVEYKDAFPISLSGLQTVTQVNDVEYLTATVTFKYSYYEIKKR